MHILPAVDIKDGRPVRLLRGRAEDETVYGDSPLDAARRWVDEGATWLHVVDLDAAFGQGRSNEDHVLEIARAVPVPVQTGGGIRSLDRARRLVDGGVARVVVGTRALESRAFLDELIAALPGKVAVGVDVREGKVAVRGWTETSAVAAETFLAGLRGSGVAAVVYTDIARDGALRGPNVAATHRATELVDAPVVASGGVTTVEDVCALAALSLEGIVIGKALYEGALTLAQARRALGEHGA